MAPGQKPTCFLSHSSEDAAILRRLQTALETKTSGTITFFLSSDGKSLRFGRNWNAELEQALSTTAVMFTLLTPNSVESRWVYFEAGHAYSRGVEVIPVAFLGLEMNQIGPPLSLLQGFDLKDHNGLNNIVAILNRRFDYHYPLDFNETDWLKLLSDRKHEDMVIDHLFDYAAIHMFKSADSPPEVEWDAIRHAFDKSGMRVFATDKAIYAHGVECHKQSTPYLAHFTVAARAVPRLLPLIEEARIDLGRPQLAVSLFLRERYKVRQPDFQFNAYLSEQPRATIDSEGRPMFDGTPCVVQDQRIGLTFESQQPMAVRVIEDFARMALQAGAIFEDFYVP